MRDRAVAAFYLAAGLRFSELLVFDLDQVDHYTGWVKLVQEGDRERALRTDLHCRRFRHTWAQTALARGAEPAVVEEAMGWTSDAIVRRYGGWVRSPMAAEAMPRFAPRSSRGDIQSSLGGGVSSLCVTGRPAVGLDLGVTPISARPG